MGALRYCNCIYFYLDDQSSKSHRSVVSIFFDAFNVSNVKFSRDQNLNDTSWKVCHPCIRCVVVTRASLNDTHRAENAVLVVPLPGSWLTLERDLLPKGGAFLTVFGGGGSGDSIAPFFRLPCPATASATPTMFAHDSSLRLRSLCSKRYYNILQSKCLDLLNLGAWGLVNKRSIALVVASGYRGIQYRIVCLCSIASLSSTWKIKGTITK